MRGSLLGVVCALLIGCATPPTVSSVLKRHYRGYDQIAPASGLDLTHPQYKLIPGALIVLNLEQPATSSRANVWSTDNSYCPPGYSIANLRMVRRPPAAVDYRFDFSTRRLLGLRRAKEQLNLEENEVQFLRRVTIRVSNARTFKRKGTAQLDDDCLTWILHRAGTHRLESILVGDLHVDVLFKDNVSLLNRFHIVGKLRGAIGIEVLKAEQYTSSDQDLVFGILARPFRPK